VRVLDRTTCPACCITLTRYLEAGGGRGHLGAALMQEGLALPAGAGSDFGSTLVRLSRL
jgi:hypothetical protein